MSAEFPSLNHGVSRPPPNGLSAAEKREMVNDYHKQDQRHGRGPYVVNGVPISEGINGCCIKDPCYCRSDVIFYNGQAFDQKLYNHAYLRTRPGNVMFLEGKLTPPFNPGKSPQVYGPYRNCKPKPTSIAFNSSQFGKGFSPCCTTSIYGDTEPPYHNVRAKELAFTDAGLPHGETIGYFRFKTDGICDCGGKPVSKMEQCCTCESGEYNPAQYAQDLCPSKQCCC